MHLWNSKNTGSGIGRPLLVVKVLHTRGKAKERQTQLVMTHFCGSVIRITKNKQHNCDIVDYIIQQRGKNKQWYACMQVTASGWIMHWRSHSSVWLRLTKSHANTNDSQHANLRRELYEIRQTIQIGFGQQQLDNLLPSNAIRSKHGCNRRYT